jgi:general secretion pathway protein K
LGAPDFGGEQIMSARPRIRQRERGAALLMAMLTVALVATFAAASLWQQWRSIEVEGAERARVQSEWILTGALDWARLLLREDARAGGPDHLGEPWAVPLQEARLSSFLAADNNNVSTDAQSEVLDAFLSGQITDLQSLLNVTNLVGVNGKVSEPDFESFARLFELLQLPSGELEQLSENLLLASAPGEGNHPLLPQRVDQLVWLGLSSATVSALRPYITVLPAHTPVNINTASAEVIYAAAPDLSMAEAQHLVAERDALPFRSLTDATRLLSKGAASLPEGQGLGVATTFFEVRARLRLDQLVVEERSVIQRSGVDVKVLQRERGPAGPPLGQATANR